MFARPARNRKVSDEVVTLILAYKQSGMTPEAIVRQTGLPRSQVIRIYYFSHLRAEVPAG